MHLLRGWHHATRFQHEWQPPHVRTVSCIFGWPTKSAIVVIPMPAHSPDSFLVFSRLKTTQVREGARILNHEMWS
jgi:hypothetical protein